MAPHTFYTFGAERPTTTAIVASMTTVSKQGHTKNPQRFPNRDTLKTVVRTPQPLENPPPPRSGRNAIGRLLRNGEEISQDQ